jgi:hypothetical protein
MALLTMTAFVLQKPLVDLLSKWIKLRAADRRCPAITRRLRKHQHLANAIAANPELTSYLSSAKPILKVCAAHT